MTHDDSQPSKTFRGMLAETFFAIGRRLDRSTITVSEVVLAEIRAAQFSLLSAEGELERCRFTVDMLRCRLTRLRQTHGREDYSPPECAPRDAGAGRFGS